MLFDYYCSTEYGQVDVTSTTVRCANLPMHVQASVHDVASTFKRLLSVIPGGILGSLSLFDAFVAIHSQLQGDPEFPRTKHTKVRARLIALAIATVESQFRRELICAVFGLLSLIGRVAEITPREDEEGRPLPTGDLMGYNALGIVFGPLLLGDLLGLYSMKLATPKAGLLVLPLRSPKSRQDRRIRKTLDELQGPPTMDKILVANSITEMLIVNWRDVVRQMKSLGMNQHHEPRTVSPRGDTQENNFVIKKPQGWDREWRDQVGDEITRETSPEPPTPTLGISKHRSRNRGSSASRKLRIRPSVGCLSPTVEESILDEEGPHDIQNCKRHSVAFGSYSQQTTPRDGLQDFQNEMRYSRDSHSPNVGPGKGSESYIAPTPTSAMKNRRGIYCNSPRLLEEDVPPRTSSKQSTPLHRASANAQDVLGVTATGDPTTIERKGAIRKKHLEKGNRRHSIAVDWSESAVRSSDISTDKPEQTTQFEFLSEKEALEAAIKAHFDELRELDSSEQNRHPSLDAGGNQNLPTSNLTLKTDIQQTPLDRPDGNNEYTISWGGQKTTHNNSSANSASTTPRQFYAPMRSNTPHRQTPETSARRYSSRVASMPAGTPRTESLYDESTPWFSLPKRNQRQSKRPSISPTENQRGVRALAAKFEGVKSTERSPTPPSSANKTQALISQFSQGPSTRGVRSRSISVSAQRNIPHDPVNQNVSPSRNSSAAPNAVGDVISGQDLRVSIGEEAAIKAIELQQADKERKPSPSFHGQPEALTLRQTIPRRKPVPAENGIEASLKNPGSLGTMMPYPEQPPIAQHLNFVRPSSTMDAQGPDALAVPYNTATPIQRPGSTTTLHTQIRNLQRRLDLKTEEVVQLRRQLEVQEDADISTLSQQLREAKREAQMWKERAESAERRIKVFERFIARLKGIQVAGETANGKATTGKIIAGSECLQNAEQGNTAFLENANGYESDSSGAEDARVVSARMQSCLDGLTDAPGDFSQTQTRERDISPGDAEIWMAAQNLLDNEGQVQIDSGGSAK
ncbi:hypothetical protein HYE67_005453 [Fusarium culmorum]|uniref:Rho-GAP domain-containing protein n=1 Tax=Fusarium culmorum TaxID=5516 RepID=A0A7S8HVQ4_FUSCU|nr:hypothetical protein HYE67_005453 [Fusarium culmorum]